MKLLCAMDPNVCTSKIQLDETGLRIKYTQDGSGGVRCNTGIDHGKWYWEAKHTIRNLSTTTLAGHNQIGIVSSNVNVDWDKVMGFTDIGGSWNGFTTGSGIHIMSLDEYKNAPTEILCSKDIDSGYVIIAKGVNEHLDPLIHVNVNQPIGMMLDLDNDTFTFCRGNEPANRVSVNIPHGTYYPAVAGVSTALFFNTYGGLEVTMNFGEVNGFEYAVPKGYKPYYMVNGVRINDIKIY